MLKQADLARTLEAIAAEGPGLLYGGALGQKLIDRLTELGGVLTIDDMREAFAAGEVADGGGDVVEFGDAAGHEGHRGAVGGERLGDGAADPAMAESLVLNAKLRRTGVCGSTETVLIDRAYAEKKNSSDVQFGKLKVTPELSAKLSRAAANCDAEIIR